MAARAIEQSSGFKSSLRRLGKNRPGLEQEVSNALAAYAADGPPPDRIPGVDGNPVFKERLALPNQGKRGGLRIVVYCDDDRVVGLFLYLKGDKGDVTDTVIVNALKKCDLYEESTDGGGLARQRTGAVPREAL